MGVIPWRVIRRGVQEQPDQNDLQESEEKKREEKQEKVKNHLNVR